MHSPAWRSILRRTLVVYIPVAALVVLTLFPFYWMVVTSFKDNADLNSTTANPFLVKQATLDNFVYLLTKTRYVEWLKNTLVISVFSTALSLLISVMAGYSLGRLRFRGANAIGWIVFITYLVPQTLLFLPLTVVVRQVDDLLAPLGIQLYNSAVGMILLYPTFLVPFGTWLLIGYFKSIPRELEESALVDGATRLQAMTRIVVPLALPGLLSVGIFSFTLSWNEFIYALVFLTDPSVKTVPVGVVSELVRADVYLWGQLMAGALLGSVPVAIIYSFFVEYFVAGMTAGAVKG
jgi:multiple sugar transport system permease protein